MTPFEHNRQLTTPRHLFVQIGHLHYRVPAEQVCAVIQTTACTHVLQPPSYRSGFITHEGRAIPTVDFRRDFGSRGTSHLARTIVLKLDLAHWMNHEIGLVVDRIEDPATETSEASSVAGEGVWEDGFGAPVKPEALKIEQLFDSMVQSLHSDFA